MDKYTLQYILSVPKFTANLNCIYLSIDSGIILKQMQYRFVVNFWYTQYGGFSKQYITKGPRSVLQNRRFPFQKTIFKIISHWYATAE